MVSAVTVEEGAIHVRFGNRANGALRGKVLTLSPAVVEDAPIVPMTWLCGSAALAREDERQGPNRTDVPPRYLPARCR